MSKAILVLDEMPETCPRCWLVQMELHDANVSPYCGVAEGPFGGWRTIDVKAEGRPDWCPLQEVEPVRHGHWKALRGDWDGLYECQECGNRFGTPYYYCPACGVKMDCVDGGAE